MRKFWHHWFMWCWCSLLMVKRDWSSIRLDWQTSVLWGTLVIFQDIHKLWILGSIVSFLTRGNVLAPTTPHLQYSPQPLFPSLYKHHLEKINWLKVSCLLADPPDTHVSSTLQTTEWQNTGVHLIPSWGLGTILCLITYTQSRSGSWIHKKTGKWNTILFF